MLPLCSSTELRWLSIHGFGRPLTTGPLMASSSGEIFSDVLHSAAAPACVQCTKSARAVSLASQCRSLLHPEQSPLRPTSNYSMTRAMGIPAASMRRPPSPSSSRWRRSVLMARGGACARGSTGGICSSLHAR
ncbi:hypothetical protein VPH35_109736 [Triticum aestivum]